MKTLLLFAIESSGRGFDEAILSMLSREQEKYKALYRMDIVRVRLGSENRFSADSLAWDVRMNESGEVADLSETEECVSMLTTRLISRMAGAAEGCEMVMIGSGDARSALAVMHLGWLVNKRMLGLAPVNTHLMLLQNQEVHKDADTARLMDAVRSYNSEKPAYYSTLYMLPWESVRQEATRRSVGALIKTIILGGGHALSVPGALRAESWVETAAVTRLMPPVAQISHKVFRSLADNFMTGVLEPALAGSDDMDVRVSDLQSCVHEIVSSLLELERRNGLPSPEELYMIMPVQNPTITLSPKDSVAPVRAWELIYSIYGEKTGGELEARMNPDMDALVAEYDALRPNITVLLLRKVLEVGAKRSDHGMGFGFEKLPVLIDLIQKQVLSRLESQRLPFSQPQKYSMALLPRQKHAVGNARTRHMLLDTVYDHALKTFGSKRAELRAKMFRSAAEYAKTYLSDCLLEIRSQFHQMCSIRDTNVSAEGYFSYRMDEAYDHWCRQKLTDKVGLPELYECFTEEICRMPYDQAAAGVVDMLEKTLDARTRAATGMIKAHLNSFFAELKYRAGFLESIDGKKYDLDSKLLEYLQSQSSEPPLLKGTIGWDLKPVSRMFIIHRSAGSDAFARLIIDAHDNTGILNDPYEDGVQMIVKYAGNALDDLLVARNNPSGTV